MLEAIGPRLDRDALLDLYSSHTAQCATCQKGLRQVRAAMLTANIVKVIGMGYVQTRAWAKLYRRIRCLRELL